MGLKGSEYVNPKAWFSDFTYDEAHALTVGFAPAFFGVIFSYMGQDSFAMMMLSLSVAGFGVAWQVDSDLVASVKFGDYWLRVLPTERHYYGGGAVLGALDGVIVGVIIPTTL